MQPYGYGTEGFAHSGHGSRSGRPQPWDYLVCLVDGLRLCHRRFVLAASGHALLDLVGERLVPGSSRLVHLVAPSKATLGLTLARR